MEYNGNPYAAPTKFTNVVLIVEGKKLHVSKEYLAAHSPVMDAMFFADFAEKGKQEIEIKNVVYKEFVDLLNVFHPTLTPITDASVLHILKLADQFQIKTILELSENVILTTDSFNIMKKLLLAEQYNLKRLMNHLFNSFQCVCMVGKLKDYYEYLQISDVMKLKIYEKMMELVDSAHWNRCRCSTHHGY